MVKLFCFIKNSKKICNPYSFTHIEKKIIESGQVEIGGAYSASILANKMVKKAGTYYPCYSMCGCPSSPGSTANGTPCVCPQNIYPNYSNQCCCSYSS